MSESGPYQPVKLKECTRCGGTGFIHPHKRGSPYEAPGPLMCPRCNGAKFVIDRPDPDEM